MGLIKAAIGSFGGAMADTWKEFFTCDSISKDVLVVRGHKQTSRRSSNTRGNDNVITDGSGIAVADGQCMIITEQGKVVDICSEPGQYTYKTDLAPSIFCGNLGEGIKKTFEEIGKRFVMGGDTGKDQRVYYVNLKEIIDNKFGTATPIPFRIVDMNIGLDLDTSVRCNGIYTFKINNPILFYTNVCGNVADEYTKSEIAETMKSEFISALQPAFAEISAMGIRPNMLPAQSENLAKAMNRALTEKWLELRGVEVVSVSVNSATLPEEDQAAIKEKQLAATMRDPAMYAAQMGQATAEAMKTAAGNAGGAAVGFMGMNFAGQMGGSQQSYLDTLASTQNTKAGWTCSCGMMNSGKFCQNCGKPQPAPAGTWVCSCGASNTGNFCQNCGSPKPNKDWVCSCGATNSGKFCQNCGKPRD